MKKNLLILISLIAVLACIFAITVSAETTDPFAPYYDDIYVARDNTPLALYEKDGENYYPLAWFYNSETEEYESFKVDVDVRFCYVDTENSIAAGKDFRENANVVFTDETKTYTMSNLILVNLQQSKINMFSGTWKSLPIEAIYCNNNLHYVNSNTFNNCSTLTVFDIPKTHSGTSGTLCSAFSGTNVKELYIPQYLCLLGGAFNGCTGLERVEFAPLYTPKGWADWQTTQGKESWFFNCTNLETVILPTDANSTHTYIGGQTFENCSSLTTIEIPSYITEIRYDAFRGCTSITSITIPASVTSIGGSAFASSGLETITFAQGCQLTSLPAAMLEKCTSLTRLEIPEGVVSLGNSVCNGCSKLATLSLPTTLSNVKVVSSDNSHFEGTAITTLIGLENTKITDIPNDFMKGAIDANIGTLKLPATVTSIGQYAFADCCFEKVVLSPILTTFSSSEAFVNCPNLKEVYVPGTITNFGSSTFKNNKTNDICFFVVSNDNDYLAAMKSAFGAADVVAIENYDKTTYATGRHIISGVNFCDAFYGEHAIDENNIAATWLGEKFLSVYKVTCPCGRNCGVETVIEELPALIVDNGFAYGPNSMLQGVAVDRDLLEAYSNYFTGIKFGLVAAAKSAQSSASIINANGEGVNGYVAAVDYTERDYDLFEMNLFGISENYQATEFYFGAYVIANGQVYYIHNGTTNNEAQAITYNDVVVIVDALVPEKEEE